MFTISRTTQGEKVIVEKSEEQAVALRKCGVVFFPTKEEAETELVTQQAKEGKYTQPETTYKSSAQRVDDKRFWRD